MLSNKDVHIFIWIFYCEMDKSPKVLSIIKRRRGCLVIHHELSVSWLYSQSQAEMKTSKRILFCESLFKIWEKCCSTKNKYKTATTIQQMLCISTVITLKFHLISHVTEQRSFVFSIFNQSTFISDSRSRQHKTANTYIQIKKKKNAHRVHRPTKALWTDNCTFLYIIQEVT